MEREQKKPLDIPMNTSDRNDIVQGVGKKEALIIVITFFICMIIAAIGYLCALSPMISIGSAIFILAIVISIVVRDTNNESFIDKMKFMFRYFQTQKTYEYKYYKIGEDQKK